MALSLELLNSAPLVLIELKVDGWMAGSSRDPILRAPVVLIKAVVVLITYLRLYNDS